jgi:hypothetical protein
VALVNEPPIPKNNPATGKIAIGSINDLPTRCKTLKILSFIIPSPFLFIFCDYFELLDVLLYSSQKKHQLT